MHSQHLILAVLMTAASSIAAAAPPAQAEEARMVVTGTIDVAADGTLSAHTIDHANQIDAHVRALIERSIQQWRFRPMTSEQKATMRLVLRGRSNGHDGFEVKVASVDFVDTDADSSLAWSPLKMAPPEYPREALLAGAGGTVYLYVRMDPGGTVRDAWVAEVDLDMRSGSSRLASVLGNAAKDEARHWRLRPPAHPDLSDTGMTVMVPVSFSTRVALEEYGHWETYFPGVHHPAPWITQPEPDPLKNPAALAANGIYSLERNGPQLLTALDPD